MAIPETDPRISRWCRERVPEHLWDQARVEAEVADRHVTIIETRPPWDRRRLDAVPGHTSPLHCRDGAVEHLL